MCRNFRRKKFTMWFNSAELGPYVLRMLKIKLEQKWLWLMVTSSQWQRYVSGKGVRRRPLACGGNLRYWYCRFLCPNFGITSSFFSSSSKPLFFSFLISMPLQTQSQRLRSNLTCFPRSSYILVPSAILGNFEALFYYEFSFPPRVRAPSNYVSNVKWARREGVFL